MGRFVNIIQNKNDYKSWTYGRGGALLLFGVGVVGVLKSHCTFAKFLCSIG
jgi:hypothetical protein